MSTKNNYNKSPRTTATTTIHTTPKIVKEQAPDTHHKKVTSSDLTTSIDHLTQTIRHRTSRHYRFLIGIVTGIGTVIGATVLAGVVIYILGLIVAGLDLSSIPFLHDLIQQANLDPTTTP